MRSLSPQAGTTFPQPTSPTLGERAADLGLPVFPCGGDKRPIVKRGFKEATQEHPKILRMFNKPGAVLIGVPTGEASGHVIVDVDHHGAVSGRPWLDANKDALPQTRTHRTGGGGLHLVFAYPAGRDIRNSAGRIAPGVDVRANGGYACWPPSPGYEIVDDTPPAEMPEWLIKACCKPDPGPQPIPGPKAPPCSDDGSRYGLVALTNACNRICAAPFGKQEETLNKETFAIGSLVAGGELAGDFALADLTAAGRAMPSQAGRDAWHPAHVEDKVRKAFKDGKRTPRQAPPRPITTAPASDGHPSSRHMHDPGYLASVETDFDADLDDDEDDDAPEPVDPAPLANGAATTSTRRIADLPPIRIVAGDIDLTATAGEHALIASGMPVYRRGTQLVRPTSHVVPASGSRTTVAVGLDTITQPSLIDILNQAVGWEKYNARTRSWRPCDPAPNVAAVILSRAPISCLPSIAGVITTPTLRPDGSVLLDAGYDTATRLYHVPDHGLRMQPLPEKPTRLDADRALDTLSRLLDEFPFVGDVDRSVALSAIITAVVRGVMPVAPMHAFRATVAGSGKSYLADIISLIASGQLCPVMAVSVKEDETEKRLVGLLLAGFPIISLDNVNGELGGDLLCQAIERPLIRARPLGGSDILEIENHAVILANGNAVRVKGDMTRRTLLSTLDAKVKRPELRSFSSDPAKAIIQDRGRYVGACLIIVRAYLAAGKPGVLSPLASFEEWSSWVRSALLWLGCADPVASMELAREDDPELSEHREVLGCLEAVCSLNEGYTVSELVQKMDERVQDPDYGHATDKVMYPEFRDALLKVAGFRGEVNTKRLARWFLDREGKIVGGLRIKRKGVSHSALRWSVSRD